MPDSEIDANTPDWSREVRKGFAWDPSRSLLASIRDYQRYSISANPWHVFKQRIAILRHRFWSVITGADIPLSSQIGGGLLLPHPNGVVVHASAKIGPNCIIFQQVTIGTRGTKGVPQIGGHVDIGAGAKILGPIAIGDHVLIGANSVVITNVPDNCIAFGVPAVTRSQRKDEAS